MTSGWNGFRCAPMHNFQDINHFHYTKESLYMQYIGTLLPGMLIRATKPIFLHNKLQSANAIKYLGK